MVAGEALGIQLVEGVAAELAIRLTIAQHVIGDDEDAVATATMAFLSPRRLTSRRYWAAR